MNSQPITAMSAICAQSLCYSQSIQLPDVHYALALLELAACEEMFQNPKFSYYMPRMLLGKFCGASRANSAVVASVYAEY